METALILPIPEADPAVAPWRERYDPSASEGVPAHVTVLVPFMPINEIDEACVETLSGIFGGHRAFELSFARLERFPETLWLAPEPDAPIQRLAEAIVAQFPDYPPYGGEFDNVIPHLTIAQGDGEALDRIAEEIIETIALPIRARIHECVLYEHVPGQWQERHRFSLRS